MNIVNICTYFVNFVSPVACAFKISVDADHYYRMDEVMFNFVFFFFRIRCIDRSGLLFEKQKIDSVCRSSLPRINKEKQQKINENVCFFCR